jgi:predicted alpha/beta-hydrolase family hydrolase
VEPRTLSLDLQNGRTTALIYSARAPALRPAALILAHGAGAPQHHPFMVRAAHGLAERGLDVLTFNFLYMEARRKVPDRMPQLLACYRAAIDLARLELESARDRLFICGKSLGGRVATQVPVEYPAAPARGIVLLGYPLHPPGRPDKPRDAHLPEVRRPMLFIQGSRDAFGTPSELKPVIASLAPLPTLHTVEGGDHSLKVATPRSEGAARGRAVDAEVYDTIVDWINRN